MSLDPFRPDPVRLGGVFAVRSLLILLPPSEIKRRLARLKARKAKR